MSHINVDPAYNAIDRDDFETLIQVDRYADRSGDFDEIIARTHEHFWNPLDPDYIDFSQPFDMKQDSIIPQEMVGEFHSAVGERMDAGQRIEFTNQSGRFMLSQILHGEQGALSLSTSLCQILVDPGAVEYASNQVREEARHVTAFTEYMKARFDGDPYPVGPTLGKLMHEIYLAPEVYKKLVGMQMLIEGLAMGAFATLHGRATDPVLRRVAQLVMTDEAFHHKFGKIWADKTVPSLTEEEHESVELWAAQCFQTLLFNLINAEQKQMIYEPFGLDWRWVLSAVREAFSDSHRRRIMTESTNIFRVLIKTLLKAGIITERTRGMYAAWVDMEELARESDEVVGLDIAEQGVAELSEINRSRKKIGRALRAG